MYSWIQQNASFESDSNQSFSTCSDDIIQQNNQFIQIPVNDSSKLEKLVKLAFHAFFSPDNSKQVEVPKAQSSFKPLYTPSFVKKEYEPEIITLDEPTKIVNSTNDCNKSQKNLIVQQREKEEEYLQIEDEQTSQQSCNYGNVSCEWINCKKMFYDDDELYDHLTFAHIDDLSKLVIAEQCEIEKQTNNNGGLKRRRCGSNSTIENTKERFRCQWRKCEQYPRRGDAQKKLDWLLNHLVVRHAPKSRPHKCLFEGCKIRFSKVGPLRDHIRCAHTEINTNKQNGRKSIEEKKSNVKISCFEFRPLVYFPIATDCIDSRIVQWTRNQMNNSEKPGLIFSHKNVKNTTTRGRGRRIIKVEIEEDCKSKQQNIIRSNTEKNIILPRRISINEAQFHIKSLFKRAC